MSLYPRPLVTTVLLYVLLNLTALDTSCQLKKNAQCESCKLSFVWGKMRIVARETVPQIALRNCTKEVGEGGVGREDSIYV